MDVSNSEVGHLAGRTLAVKDIFPVRGYPNGWGQPTRLAEADVDQITHTEVQKLLDAGASCLGKSQCEELCFSLMGSNKHYGQPVNTAAPERLTGGSSSGSASLVAGGAVDIATASDTAGSIRAPASFCGLIGLRPTHGVLSLEGAMPLAPSFDCFGWFARDAQLYAEVAEVLLGREDSRKLSRLLIAPEFLDLLSGDAERAAFENGGRSVREMFNSAIEIALFPVSLEYASKVFVTHQSYEAWQALGPWVMSRHPDLDAPIADRFKVGASISSGDFEKAKTKRSDIADTLQELIGSDGVLLLPTVPSCAPLKSESADSLHAFRLRMLQLLCLSGLAGMPQITVPLASVHGAPFGISLLGPKGSDWELVSLAQTILSSNSSSR